MKFLETTKPVEGVLRIEKYFPDGTTEKVFEENNLIVLASRQNILANLYSTPVSITSLIGSGNTATATTIANHGLSSGTLVVISGAVPAEYNGVFEVVVTGLNTFQYYTLTTISSTPATGVIYVFPTVKPDPINSLKIGIGGGLDSRTIANCSISVATTTLTSSNPGFLISDIGQTIIIPGAGPGGDPLNVIVTGYTDAYSISISDSAATGVSNVTVTVGKGLFPKQEDPAQTDLISPVQSLSVSYTVDSSAPSVTYIADATQSMANGLLLTEAGLFRVSGAIFNVKNHPGIPKTSDFGVHYVWTIKYA